jgi:hypothetical protein
MLLRITNHLLSSLLCFATAANTIPQQGIHTRGYNSLGLVGSPQPQRGGLQSPNRTITPVGATLPCKVSSSGEDNTPRHHVREYHQVFPHQPTKYEETHQRW